MKIWGLCDIELENDDLIVYNVPREDVETKNFKCFDNMLKFFERNAKVSRHKLIILFDGYDSEDDKEIFEIKEIRDYVKIIFDKYSYITYFLEKENIQLLIACISDISIVKDDKCRTYNMNISFNSGFAADTLLSVLIYLCKFAPKDIKLHINEILFMEDVFKQKRGTFINLLADEIDNLMK